jgi:hypothetical protein
VRQCLGIETARSLPDDGARLVVDLSVEGGEPCRQGRDRIVVASAAAISSMSRSKPIFRSRSKG